MKARLLAKLLLVLGILLPSATLAQVPTSEEPAAAAARFEQPVRPLSKAGAVISLPSAVAPSGAAAIGLRVTSVKIVGSSVYSDQDFGPLLATVVGKDVALIALYELAQKLTAKYGNDGYVLSRAIVPPQDLDPAGATVTIQIVEGYVDAVEWPDAAAGRAWLYADYTARITAERPANIKTIMRYLLLADDLPGLDVSSTFRASTSNPNASTLIVETTAEPVDAYAQIDNRGTEGRGPWEFSSGVTFNNLLGLNEAVGVTYSGAMELSELQSLGISYSQVLNAEGLKAFSSANWTWGAPGTPALQTLEYNSQSFSLEAGLSQPLIRSRDMNLTLSELFFLSNNQAEMLGAPSSDDRLRGLRIKADFDASDTRNGTTQVNAVFSQGFEGFGSSNSGDPLASREHGRVDFTKLEATISRTQQLGKGFSLFAALQGQYAFTPLLSPEECSYGGRQFGRAFDPSELTGDSCGSVSSELRFDPDVSGTPLTQAQFYGFADYGRVFRIEPSVGTPSEDAGASAGVGLRLATENLSADISAVKPLLGRDDDGWRLFLTAGARY